jgi:RNA polymerase sigma-70 factor (ECF subfamily)
VDRDFIEAIAGAEAPSEERLAVQQAMRALPPEQREVVHMKVFEGMTFQEIADTTDEPLNTVASRYRYALEKLRAFLKQDVT